MGTVIDLVGDYGLLEESETIADLKENVKTDLKSLYVNIDILEKAMFSVQKYAEKNNLLIDYEKFISNNDIKFLTLRSSRASSTREFSLDSSICIPPLLFSTG